MLTPMLREQLQVAVRHGVMDAQMASRLSDRMEKIETAYLHSGIYPDRFFWAANTILNRDPDLFDLMTQKELICAARKLIKAEW